jgi:acyl carrier protein
VQSLLEKAGEVWNMYGPTETTVWSTCYRLTDPQTAVLIGRPIANTQCYVLDEQQQPMPIGVAGELYIGGHGVTAGYLGRPDLTGERFIADPFRDEAGAKMYRTGDLVRWRHDGELEYFQRIDNQVKIRGFRIELGEIEAGLLTHPNILEAAVAVHSYDITDKRLVAYMRFAPGKSIPNIELRKYLREIVPDYMIPQLFIELEKMPLTPNGKIDRKSLPEPVQNLVQQKRQIAPRTEIEKVISTIWCELLKLDSISIDDHFFDIGGHSLLALKVIYKLEDHFKFRISPLDVLMNSLEQMAKIIETEINKKYEPEVVEIKPDLSLLEKTDNKPTKLNRFFKRITSI